MFKILFSTLSEFTKKIKKNYDLMWQEGFHVVLLCFIYSQSLRIHALNFSLVANTSIDETFPECAAARPHPGLAEK